VVGRRGIDMATQRIGTSQGNYTETPRHRVIKESHKLNVLHSQIIRQEEMSKNNQKLLWRLLSPSDQVCVSWKACALFENDASTVMLCGSL
jgi:hypothetical protein